MSVLARCLAPCSFALALVACGADDGNSPGNLTPAMTTAGAGSAATAGSAAAGTGAATSGTAGGALPAAGRGGVGQAGSTAGASGAPLSAAGSGGASGAAAGSGGAIAAGSGGVGVVAGGGGSAGGAGAPAAGSGGVDLVADCGAGGVMGKASNAAGGQGSGYGHVRFTVSAGNQILRMRTTLETPVKPNGTQTLFLWPGLEPLQGGEKYQPIGTGVLQPVLTWGGSCAPGSPQTRTGSNWWISAQYVNTLGSDPDHRGCYGGPVMNVETGNLLLIDMSVKGTIWNQKITNQANDKSVDFDMDLGGQVQRWALFEIEMPTSTKPAADVVFTNTVIELAKPEPKMCQPTTRGTNDYFSTPISSSDGMRCCVARLVLRAQGVAASTMDP